MVQSPLQSLSVNIRRIKATGKRNETDQKYKLSSLEQKKKLIFFSPSALIWFNLSSYYLRFLHVFYFAMQTFYQTWCNQVPK